MTQYKYTQQKGFEKSEGDIFSDGSLGIKWEDADYGDDVSFLVKAGYGIHSDDGSSEHFYYSRVQVFVKKDNENIAITLLPDEGTDTSAAVVLTETPEDLIDLRLKLAPFISMKVLSQFCDSIFGLAAKAFRAWHGHRQDHCCRECDPETWEMLNSKKR
jgi:hypothetical protein